MKSFRKMLSAVLVTVIVLSLGAGTAPALAASTNYNQQVWDKLPTRRTDPAMLYVLQNIPRDGSVFSRSADETDNMNSDMRKAAIRAVATDFLTSNDMTTRSDLQVFSALLDYFVKNPKKLVGQSAWDVGAGSTLSGGLLLPFAKEWLWHDNGRCSLITSWFVAIAEELGLMSISLAGLASEGGEPHAVVACYLREDDAWVWSDIQNSAIMKNDITLSNNAGELIKHSGFFMPIAWEGEFYNSMGYLVKTIDWVEDIAPYYTPGKQHWGWNAFNNWMGRNSFRRGPGEQLLYDEATGWWYKIVEVAGTTQRWDVTNIPEVAEEIMAGKTATSQSMLDLPFNTKATTERERMLQTASLILALPESWDAEYKFHPNQAATRRETISMMITYAFTPIFELATPSFTDVSADDKMLSLMEIGVERGIINGVGGGKFAPDALVTREDAFVMIYRIAQWCAKNGYDPLVEQEKQNGKKTVNFNDMGKVSGYAKEAVQTLAELGVINGKGNNTLDPKGQVTRAEVVQLIYNLFTTSSPY